MFKISKLSLVFLTISLFNSEAKEPRMITIPLKVIRNSPGKYPISKYQNITIEKEEEVKTIFGKKIRKLKEVIHGEISILECTLFALPITISNDQNFNVVLDTGSAALWVPKTGSNDSCKIDHHYDPSKSTTGSLTTETFEIRYGTGATKGYYYTDYIKFVVDNSYSMKFGAADQTDFDVTGADGIMGLAKKYNSNQYSPIWTLQSKDRIPNKSFSFKFIKEKEMVEMYLGDEHEDFLDKKNTAQCQLLHETTYDNLLWTCKLYSFGLITNNGSSNSTVSCGFNFLFDTGSNVMILPKKIMDQLFQNFNDELKEYNCYNYLESPKNYRIYCDGKYHEHSEEVELPDLFIEVGDHYLILDHEEMYYYSRIEDSGINKDIYLLNVIFEEDITISLIGQPFFKMFHTKFDPENKVLKFYSEKKGSIIYSSEKPDDDKADSFEPMGSNWWNEKTIKMIAAFGVVIAAFLVLICFCKCCKKIFCKRVKSSAI